MEESPTQIFSPQLNLTILFTQSYLLFNAHSAKEIYDIENDTSKLSLQTEITRSISNFKPTMIIISAGHHFIKGRYSGDCKLVTYCDHNEVEWDKFEKALMNFNLLLKQAISLTHQSIQVVWRSVPTRHFSFGEWNTGGQCIFNEPCFDTMMDELTSVNESSNYYRAYLFTKVIQRVAAAKLYHYLDITRSTMDRCDSHSRTGSGRIGGTGADCVHFCVPGVPDMWHDDLLKWL
jgi:hypothetical protein